MVKLDNFLEFTILQTSNKEQHDKSDDSGPSGSAGDGDFSKEENKNSSNGE